MDKAVHNSNPELVDDDFNSDFIDSFYELDKQMSGRSVEPVSSSEIAEGDQSDKDVKSLSNHIKRRSKSSKASMASESVCSENVLRSSDAIKATVFVTPETYFKLSIIRGLTKKSISKIIGRGIDLVIAEYAEKDSEFRKYLS